MQAFILGAGLGTRLAPLSLILPKPLLPVFQKPLIQHMMDHFLRAGVTEFMVNTSQLEMMWERAFPFPDPQYRGVPVFLSHEEQPLDSGGGLKKIMPRVRADEPLLVHNGDILSDLPIHDLLAEHRRSGNLVTLALRSCDGKRNVGFDPATRRITDMRHALGVDPGSYQFAGTYVMQPEVAALFPPEECFSIVPVWLELIRRGRVGGVVCDWARWCEMGTPRDYLDAVLELPSSQRLHPTAAISPAADVSEDSVVCQDAVVPAGCVLNDCIVWPRTHVAPGEYTRCILTPRLLVQA
ncbi:MAG: NTP transferase domain-containing protein [Akkermansiaceae bacterium]|nr:NTP transferase domain-containing protein [Akkermansiaceae bacterium]